MNWKRLVSASAYWHDSHRLLFNKDCRNMSDLSDESVQMVCCSPPYWGLRKYAGLPDLVWGGKEECQHNFNIDSLPRRNRGNLDIVDPNSKQATNFASAYDATPMKTCALCGAWKGQLGLEPSPELYISHLIEIFREVKRVLRKDGVVFLNIGDSYYGSGGDHKEGGKNDAGFQGDLRRGVQAKQQRHNLLKPKDLCLIPFRLAIALQNDGWWCRSVIIWSKNNPMPESVKDRPSESHEYILMLTKSARYFWDQEAVRTRQADVSIARMQRSHSGYNPGYPYGSHNHLTDYYTHFEGKPVEEIAELLPGANLRSVWEFPTQSFSGAHFATYPEELVKRCILAATPEAGCCPKCGKAWVRIIEKQVPPRSLGTAKQQDYVEQGNRGKGAEGFNVEWAKYKSQNPDRTLGWQPQCKCGLSQSENIGSVVLDPFAGSGTTLKVAAELNRRAIGYELSGQYCQLAVKRNHQTVMI